jgi:cell division protein FtsI (penicillin-binding protein 3)
VSGARRPPTGRTPTRAPARRPAAPPPRHARTVTRTVSRTAPARPRTTTRPKRAPARPLPPIRLRLIAILVVVVLAFAAIGVRLFDLQARDRSHLVSLGLGQRVRTVAIPAERGNIFDRSGKVLAVSVPQTTVVADPRVIKDPVAYAAKIAPIVQVDEAALEERLSNRTSAFAYVARKVNDQVADQVRKLGLVGISFQDESRRFYPDGTVAGPVVGFVGTDNTGLGGMEYHFDKLLTGSPGSAQVERDPQGNDIPGGQSQVTPAKRGQDLVLTLDASLQWNTEQALLQQVVGMNAKGGTAVIVDVQTGDVLAMATVDGATDTQPAHVADATENNRPITDAYEPGSTNKVITMSGAIQEGLVSPDTTFEVEPSINVGGFDYPDAEDHPTETMTVADILAQSSNVGTIKIAHELGPTRLAQYLDKFGFGHSTGLDLPGESAGSSFTMNNYTDTSMGSIPIGYGIAVTPMQMLDVYTTIANHGMARPPRLVAATIDASGKRHDEKLPAPHQVISPATADALKGMLAKVVSDPLGTGTKAQIPGYPVAGKTGTAKKVPYDTGEYNASFAGFAPVDNPRLAAIVVMDSPQGSIFGADAAAPVFQQIMRFALTYERVPTTS